LRIPPDKIEDVRSASDILSVVQGYVSLKKKGQNWFGLCPFHTENTPSFAVNPGRQIFRCFGCGRGGNVFTFLMELERITFVEAVRMLAEKAGIELPAPQAGDGEEYSESEDLVRVNGWARDFFHRQLTEGKSAGAQEAREYLRSRGYGKPVIDRYLLGYAPDAWDSLCESAREAGLSLSLLMQAGLLKEGKEKNRPYDAFRHRIMFPIRNLAGRVIAFGGRRLREEESAKYINSPETAVYRKGRELFGLWEARNDIRTKDEAILVEGYTDCLSLVMAGVTVAVASLGTALTEQQARLLKRFTSRVFILYDGDSAGLGAARRAVDVLLGVGASPRVMVLPEQEDPDSFVRRQGGEAVWKLRNEALSPVEFQLLLASRARGSISEAAKELIASAALIASPVEQDVFLQQIAAKTGISSDALRRELARVRTPRPSDEATAAREKWPPPGAVTSLARVLVRNPELRPLVFEKWKPEAGDDQRMSELLAHLYGEWESETMREPESLLDRFPESPMRDFLAECLYEESGEVNEHRQAEIDQQIALDCLRTLEAASIREKIAELKRHLAAAPDDRGLLAELQDLMRKEKELRARGKGPDGEKTTS
jgi:DNA primase